MLSNIIGYISILLGVLWFIKPEALRNRLKKKINRKMKWVIYGFIIVFSIFLIGSAIKAQGLIMKIIALVGMFIAIRIIMMITSKTSEKMLEWLATRPVIFFRIWALFVILFGIMLIVA